MQLRILPTDKTETYFLNDYIFQCSFQYLLRESPNYDLYTNPHLLLYRLHTFHKPHLAFLLKVNIQLPYPLHLLIVFCLYIVSLLILQGLLVNSFCDIYENLRLSFFATCNTFGLFQNLYL